jgi:hypothetical protein
MLRFTSIGCRQVTFTPMHLASWRAVVRQLDAMCRPKHRLVVTRRGTSASCPMSASPNWGLLYEAKPCIIHCGVSAGISRKPSRLLSACALKRSPDRSRLSFRQPRCLLLCSTSTMESCNPTGRPLRCYMHRACEQPPALPRVLLS